MSTEPAASSPAAPAAPPDAAASLPPLETVTGSKLLSEMPVVNERAVSASEPLPAAPSTPGEPIKSRNGLVFDPARHRVKPDGSPFRNKYGNFMPLGGRKRGGHNRPEPAKVEPTGSTVPGNLPGSHPPPPPDRKIPTIIPEIVGPEFEPTAEAYLKSFYGLADRIFRGKGEWKPDDDAEHGAMRDSTVACMKATGRKPHPVWAWVFMVFGYIMERLSRPNTAQTVDRWFAGKPGSQPNPEPGKPDAVSHPTALAVVARRPAANVQEQFFGG